MFPSEIILQPPGGFMFNANFLSIKHDTSLITGFLFKPSIGYRLPEDTKFSRTFSLQIPEVNIHTSGEISHNQKDPEYIDSYSDGFTYDVITQTLAACPQVRRCRGFLVQLDGLW